METKLRFHAYPTTQMATQKKIKYRSVSLVRPPVNRLDISSLHPSVFIAIFLIASGVTGFLWYRDWVFYQWASREDTIEAYQDFNDTFQSTRPNSPYLVKSKARLLELQEDSSWQTAKATDTPEALNSYLETYPQGKHIQEAKTRLSELYEVNWQAVSETRSVPELEQFIAQNPGSPYISDAQHKINSIKDDARWRMVAQSRSESELNQFIQKNPNSRHIQAAKTRLSELYKASWQAVSETRSVPELEQFIAQNPGNPYVSEAKLKIDSIKDDARWSMVAQSRSESELNQFIQKNPNSRHIQTAKARITSFYNDYAWVKQQNSVAAYQRYIQQNPNSPYREQAEAKIIDLEVATMRADQKAGQLPNPQTTNVFYANCSQARAAGAAPIYRGQPGYRTKLDRDRDGIGCE